MESWMANYSVDLLYRLCNGCLK